MTPLTVVPKFLVKDWCPAGCSTEQECFLKDGLETPPLESLV